MDSPHSCELDPNDIRSFLCFAGLAPSSHNTQPWRFRIDGRKVLLFADRSRALPANDPDERELTISCGCALMNLRVAAAHAGMQVEVEAVSDPDHREWLATIGVVPGEPDTGTAALFPAIVCRRTYRKPFAPRAVPEETQRQLRNAAAAEGAWLEYLNDDARRKAVASLVSEGDSMQWADPRWRRELARWMRPRHRGDGLVVPRLAAPFVRMVVRKADMGRGVGARDRALALGSPVLALLGTGEDSSRDWLNAGQALERVLLQASLGGLQASYLNQPIQVAPLRPKLQRLAGRPGFPQLLLRLGYAEEELPPAPRRRAEDLVD